MPASDTADFRRLEPFLARHHLTGDVRFLPLREGGNNRVFRLQRGPDSWVLKCYFLNPSDPRDRFGAEMAFYDFLQRHGIDRTPRPIAWDSGQRVALFQFVEGRKLQPAEITTSRVDEAAAFLLALETARRAAPPSGFSPASEACFTLRDHLAIITRRVARLRAIPSEGGEVEREAGKFVRARLAPAWEQLSTRIAASADVAAQVTPDARCLSPSDFGFHNALLGPDGSLKFLDFEYAGWDDPAKLLCDFFCQPELPADLALWEHLAGPVRTAFVDGSAAVERARVLLPAYRIKWCCIMLNEFLELDSARRAFAAGSAPSQERKARQLEKARAALDRIPLG